MAFEMEALTAEQREQFAAKQIPDPLSPVLGILKPREWIIDAGKDVFLFAIGVHRDYPNEELFFFHWKDQELERSRWRRHEDRCLLARNFFRNIRVL